MLADVNLRADLLGLVRRLRVCGVSMLEGRIQFERLWIESALTDTSGNLCKAAVQLGLHRNTLSRKMKLLGIDARVFRVLRRKHVQSEKVTPYAVRVAGGAE
ncbi:response regulator receiver protein [Candidatus Koribacter versatilis Ellin345]|uniref:Response regulator receiver protein n=2 Tax=Candidatus Korobacter versatilis TaxID=658062 RepID=Q1ILQ9_KORVE|nr:response regulator receiver protein [Candidatus Koribacter versatilis Ellin345]